MGNTGSKGGGNDGSSNKNISSNVVERSKPTGIPPRSIGIGNDITAYKDPSDKYSYPSNTTSRGGEVSKGGQSGQNYLNSSSSGGGNSTSQFNTTNSDKVFSCIKTDGGFAVKTIIELAIAKNGSGKGINALANLDVINLSSNKLDDNDALNLSSGLLGYALNVKTFYINNNSISDTGLDYLIKGSGGIQYLQMGGTEKAYIMQGLFTHYNVNITKLDLSNNNLTDVGADILSHALTTGSLPSLKITHLEGNKITKTGEGFLIKALKQISQDIMVTLEKYSTDLGQKVIKPALKEFVKYAKKNGVDTTHIATNKSTWEYMKDISKIGGKTIFGYAKCSNIIIDMLTFDTTLPSLAKSATIEMYGSKAVKKADLKVCVTWETHDAIVSPEGVDLAVKAIDLLGDGE